MLGGVGAGWPAVGQAPRLAGQRCSSWRCALAMRSPNSWWLGNLWAWFPRSSQPSS